MSKYLGKIDIKNNFVNFKPYYLYEDGAFTELYKDDLKNLLPDSFYENIWFYSVDDGDHLDWSYPQNKFCDHKYCIFDFETDELENNVNSSTGERQWTGYKFNIGKFENRIQFLEDIGVYCFIDKGDIPEDYRTGRSYLTINTLDMYKGMRVVLEAHDRNDVVLGPFSIELREEDDKFVVLTKASQNKYIIPALIFNEDVEAITLFKQPYIKIDTEMQKHPGVDVISDQELFKAFCDTLNTDMFENGRLNLTNIDGAIKNYADSLLMGNISPEIQDNRLNKLHTILTDEKNLNDNFAEIAGALLLKYGDKEVSRPVLEQLGNNPEFMRKIQRFEIINKNINKKAEELQNLSVEVEKLRQEKNAEETSVQNAIIGQKKEELTNLQNELEIVQQNLHKRKNELGIVESSSFLQAKMKELQQDVDYLERRKIRLNEDIEKVGVNLDSLFAKKTEKALELAFDGMLSSKMLQSAAEWENRQLDQNYISVIKKLKETTSKNLGKDELIEYLCTQVGKYRPTYGKNAILNMFICTTQNFLTVFSGDPGTGKTSICNIVAHVLGLTMPKRELSDVKDAFNPNRYVTVSVERGWTSKRDFIGYYNPITKQFDRSNSQLYDSLKIMDIEAKGESTNLPFLILLDEANLSPMEYYWADFMNICDDHTDNSSINLGENYRFQIPSFLRFLATINNDHTTEALSPRLIDRAWIIKLPAVKFDMTTTTKLDNFDGIKNISWSTLDDLFNPRDEEIVQISGVAKELYEEILAKFKGAKISISHRVDTSVRRYWSVAQSVFESEDDIMIDASIVALDYAIAQRILPHIDGNGEDFGKMLIEVSDICSKQNLRLSAEILNDIVQKGYKAMHYYQYFA